MIVSAVGSHSENGGIVDASAFPSEEEQPEQDAKEREKEGAAEKRIVELGELIDGFIGR